MILSLLLIYRLIKRFPALVILIYCFQMVGDSFVEIENKVEIEVEYFQEVALIPVIENEIVTQKEIEAKGNFILATSNIIVGYIRSAFYKLYILFGSMTMSGRCILPKSP